MQALDTGALIGSSGIASSGNDGLSKLSSNDAFAAAFRRALQKVPLGPDVYPCLIGGTVTISGDLASLFTLTPGDRINIEYVDCDDDLGEVLNGRIEMTVATYSGDVNLGLYVLTMDVLMIDFEVVTAADTVMSNGDSTVTIDTTGLPTIAMSITGSSLTTDTMTSSETVTDFSTAQSVDTTAPPQPYALTSSGTVDSTELSGLIDYDTPLQFDGLGPAYPYAGELLVTGASGATVRLIALDEVNVRIETDSNGDGVVDTTEDTTWDDVAL